MNFKNRMKSLACLSLVAGGLWAQNVCVSTPNTSLLLSAPAGGELRILYYGEKLAEADLKTYEGDRGMDAAYPVYGLTCITETALAVTHADGNLSLDLRYIGRRFQIEFELFLYLFQFQLAGRQLLLCDLYRAVVVHNIEIGRHCIHGDLITCQLQFLDPHGAHHLHGADGVNCR